MPASHGIIFRIVFDASPLHVFSSPIFIGETQLLGIGKGPGDGGGCLLEGATVRVRDVKQAPPKSSNGMVKRNEQIEKITHKNSSK